MGNLDPITNRGLRCSERVSSSYSTSCASRVTLVTSPMTSNEWWKDWIMITTNGTYLLEQYFKCIFLRMNINIPVYEQGTRNASIRNICVSDIVATLFVRINKQLFICGGFFVFFVCYSFGLKLLTINHDGWRIIMTYEYNSDVFIIWPLSSYVL